MSVLRGKDQPQTKTSLNSGIRKPFRGFTDSRDLFRNVSRSTRLPRRANTELRPKKLRRETGYGVSAVEELSGVQDLTPEDIIVAVMGPTGTGKSTFIQKATDRSWDIGHSLQSHTSEVKAVRVLFSDGINLVLVDTPGFDDTNKSDLDILKITAKWFEDVYRRDLEVSGILYLHRITDNRMGGTPQKNLKLFKKLCGEDYFHLVFLTTTMWSENEEEDEEIFLDRESQLQNDYWADIIRNPTQIQRFRGTRASAWNILEEVFFLAAARQQRNILEIQQELVDLSKRVPETNAGRQLHGIIGELVERQSDLMRRLQNELNKTSDPDALRALMLELNSLQRQKKKAEKDLKRLGPTIVERIRRMDKSISQRADRLDDSLRMGARRLDVALQEKVGRLTQLTSHRLRALHNGVGGIFRQTVSVSARDTRDQSGIRGGT